jgi:hypothetical protein
VLGWGLALGHVTLVLITGAIAFGVRPRSVMTRPPICRSPCTTCAETAAPLPRPRHPYPTRDLYVGHIVKRLSEEC